MIDILKKFHKCSPLFASKMLIWYKAERNKLDG
nr:MAG TPA: Helicase loader, Phage protein complex, PROTEIN BINDING [Caudoviricetes sp.]